MNKYIKILLYTFLILIPSVFVFMPFFKSLQLAWGDAPYYYPEGLKELISGLPSWSRSGINFGGRSLVLWLSPIMMVYGNLYKYFGLSNDAIIRILFYFPSVILAGIGPFLLTRYLKLSKSVHFFSSLFYVFNTYFILLIDGGQVGIALAYGIFPFTILFWKKFFDLKTVNSFLLALAFSFLLCVVDPRITIISFALLFLWQIGDRSFKNITWILFAGVILIPLNMFWLLPLVSGGSGGTNTFVSELQLSSLLNSVFMFAPHWPSNLFGKVIPPSFYFCFVPILVFGGFLFKKIDKRYFIFSLIFLFFAFLAKGSTPPFGAWYESFVNKIPFGSIFRDSSKFFIPLVFLGGILIGNTVDAILSKCKGKFTKTIVFAVCYLYLLLLIFPALTGKLNFNLSSKTVNSDYQTIYKNLRTNDNNKTLWFSAKPQVGYETYANPALNADQLTVSRPFASINEGEDIFNFLNNKNYIDWLRVFGVKYIILSGDSRNIFPNDKDIKNWSEITKLVSQTPGLTEENWGTKTPIYKISDVRPEVYSVDKLMLVVGIDIVPTSNAPATVYAEDGKFDPSVMKGVDPDSLKIVLNQGSKTDLAMSFMQKYFKFIKDNTNSEWSLFDSGQYLKYKYELLVRGYKFVDFDYGRGIAFSTKQGEKIKYIFDIPKDGKYILAKRFGTLKKQKLTWAIEAKTLHAGKFVYEVYNDSGLSVLNTVAVIPDEEFSKYTKLAEFYISTFGVTKTFDPIDFKWREVKVGNVDGLKKTYEITGEDHWLIYTQNYDTDWVSDGSGIHIPVYSMINGFYLGQGNKITIEFVGQKYLRIGASISLGSILVLLMSYFAYASFHYRRRNNKQIKNQ